MKNYPDHKFYGCPGFRKGCDYKINLEDEKYHLMNELIIPVNTSSNTVTLTIDSDQLVAGRVLIIKK